MLHKLFEVWNLGGRRMDESPPSNWCRPMQQIQTTDLRPTDKARLTVSSGRSGRGLLYRLLVTSRWRTHLANTRKPSRSQSLDLYCFDSCRVLHNVMIPPERSMFNEMHTVAALCPIAVSANTIGAALEVGQSLTIGSASRPTHMVKGGGGPTDSRRRKT